MSKITIVWHGIKFHGLKKIRSPCLFSLNTNIQHKGYSSLPDTREARSEIFCMCCTYRNSTNRKAGNNSWPTSISAIDTQHGQLVIGKFQLTIGRAVQRSKILITLSLPTHNKPWHLPTYTHRINNISKYYKLLVNMFLFKGYFRLPPPPQKNLWWKLEWAFSGRIFFLSLKRVWTIKNNWLIIATR